MGDRSAKIGMALFIAAEAMFFAGLLSAYWVLRAQAGPWPPPGQPRLPVGATGVNTVILLFSAAPLLFLEKAVRQGCRLCVIGRLGAAAAGGVLFLVIQGYEWVRLIRFGLSTVANVYGGLFYLVVGAHGLHVVAALTVLLVVLALTVRGHEVERNKAALAVSRMFWIFVVLLWPVIYGILYLL